MHFWNQQPRILRHFVLLAAFAAVLLALAGCSGTAGGKRDAQGRLHVAASFYPMAEFARQAGGSHVTVTTLVPDGTEPHDWEPTARDLGRMATAALFVYNGGVESWAPKAIEAIGKGKVNALEAGQGMIEGDDPHVWVSPRRAAREVTVIRDELIRLDPEHKADYERNTAAYVAKLERLDLELARTAAAAKRKEFVTTHAAFGYLAKDYGLTQIPVLGMNPEAEPSPAELARLVRLIREQGIRYVFFETLVSPKVAETLARSAGVRTLVLNPLEGLTAEERQAGRDFVSVMEENIRNLRTALQE